MKATSFFLLLFGVIFFGCGPSSDPMSLYSESNLVFGQGGECEVETHFESKSQRGLFLTGEVSIVTAMSYCPDSINFRHETREITIFWLGAEQINFNQDQLVWNATMEGEYKGHIVLNGEKRVAGQAGYTVEQFDKDAREFKKSCYKKLYSRIEEIKNSKN